MRFPFLTLAVLGLASSIQANPANSDRIQSFSADYEQMGASFSLQMVRDDEQHMLYAVFDFGSGDDTPVPGGDRTGHRLPELDFSYRKLDRFSIIRIEDTVTLSKIGPEGPPVVLQKHHQQAFVDGTLSYWLVAAWPLAEGLTVTVPVLIPKFPGGDDFSIRPTIFEVIGKQPVQSADGQTYECWVVRNSAGAGHNLTYVAEKPPYLIRQIAVAEDGTEQTVVLLKQVGSQ